MPRSNEHRRLVPFMNTVVMEPRTDEECLVGADYTDEEREFLLAVDTYKRRVNPRPSWAEVLRLAKALGYRRVAERSPAIPDGHRRCRGCGEDKPATTEHFYRNTKVPDGWSTHCKVCDSERTLLWKQRRRNVPR